MAFPTKLKQLCSPSYVYFIISFIGLILSAIQNMGNNRIYSLGTFSCPVSSCLFVFAFKIVVILFWTWVLNLMCKDGHSEVAWFLVLLPFVIFFMVLMMASSYMRKVEYKQLEERKKIEPLIL
jgi:uncharacterized membrane protein